MHAAFAFGRAAVALAFAEDADAAVLPFAGDHDFAVIGGAAFYRNAAGAHHGEERLNSVNAIPKQVGMMRFEMGRAVGLAAEHFAMFAGTGREGGLGKSQRGGAEHRHVVALGQAVNLQAIVERAGERFVDEERFAGLDDVGGVLEVRPAIDVFDHHRVHVEAHLGDGGVEFDTPLVGQFGRVFFHTRIARLDVGAAVLDGGHDFASRDVVLG